MPTDASSPTPLPASRRPRPRAAGAAGLSVLALLLAGCSGAPQRPADPYAAERAERRQEADARGIPAGFPGPHDTGVPLGTELEPSGSVSATTDGQVLEDLDVDGCISVKADDVVIRRVRVRCAEKERAITIEGERENLLVEDSEIDGRGSTEVAIGWGGYTLRRVNVHSTFDGPRLGSGVTIEDSWIHDIVRRDDVHGDAAQSTGAEGVLVRGNSMNPTNTRTDDPLNAAVQLGSENRGTGLSDVLIEGNYLDGGNYTVNVRGDAEVDGVRIRGNVFGDGARYGPLLVPESVEVEQDNTDRRTGGRVEVVRP
ncbi:hypothetical protein NUM3379_08480 [Kineococcus sp. NUM-3379]